MACSGDPEEGDGAVEVCSVDYSSVPSTGPVVSFSEDVVPLLQANCSIATCHRSASAAGGFDTGPELREVPVLPQSEIDALYQRLLATPVATTDIPHVRPGVVGESFLMLKLDGCQNVSGLDCSALGGNCGNQMPRNADPLEEEKLRVVREWIAQGAVNN